MAWYDEILGDQEGDYDVGTSANYGTPSNLFDYDFSKLFDSFGGNDNVDFSNLDAVRQFTGGADDASRVTSYIDQLVGGLANPTNDEELAAAISQFTGGDTDAARVTDYIDSLIENKVAENIIGDTGLNFDEALNVGGYKGDIALGGSADAIKNYANLTGDKSVLDGTDKETINKVQEVIRGLTGGKDNAALLAALLGGLLGLTKSQGGAGRVTGYQGGQGAPLTATRQALAPTGAPGAGGKRFMTDVTYAAEGGLMDIVSGQPNQNVTFMADGGLADQYINMARNMNVGDLRKADYLVRQGVSPSDAAKYYGTVQDGMAKGGISDLGSYSDGGRMLKGAGDGMSDSIPATIGGKRPARLADGEFVVSSDVVSGLGNGSSDAGAKVLYDMMDRVRKARTGTKKQGKQIEPRKLVP